MVRAKDVVESSDGAPLKGGGAAHRTFGAGYVAPHPSIRKDAVDVDSFLMDHQVYSREYLESVQAVHRTPTKAHEYAAWYWHVAARSLVGLLTGTLGTPAHRLTERSLGKRILCFTSVGTVSGLAAAVTNHVRSILYSKPDNGWVHTAIANGECVRNHSGIMAHLTWTPSSPPLWARLFHLMFQLVMFLQLLPLYFFMPSVAYAYDAYRAEEQVFNYSQAISLMSSGGLKHWRTLAKAPALGVYYYALPEGSGVHDVMLRMRADEACMHQMNIVLADLSPGDKNPFITMEHKFK